MLANSRSNAKRAGVSFDLDHGWLFERLSRGVCEITGIPLILTFPGGRGNYHPFSPSLDREVPSRGYTKDNVRVVCWAYNAAKGTATDEDVMTLARALCKKN
jgi:hypothetical protein